MKFKTPEEAIAAFEAEFERTWQECIASSKLDPPLSPEACKAAKAVFRAGYCSGAQFISGVLVEKLMAHSKTHPIEPNQ